MLRQYGLLVSGTELSTPIEFRYSLLLEKVSANQNTANDIEKIAKFIKMNKPKSLFSLNRTASIIIYIYKIILNTKEIRSIFCNVKIATRKTCKVYSG
jgi:hypothetical protein